MTTTVPRPPARIRIWTDGACKGNPGRGGWGAVLCYPEEEVELSGGEAQTTNNRMELQACIEALEHVTRRQLLAATGSAAWRCDVTTDSKYVKQGITEWIAKWLKNGWMNAKRKPVLNSDLWRRLHALTQELRVQWHWVKGHTGHAQNERADRLANAGVPPAGVLQGYIASAKVIVDRARK